MTARGRRGGPSGVRGTTRVYGILGDPVAHSLSPPMQNAAFAALGLDAVYVAFRVRADHLAATVAGLHAAGVAGLNVTVPHKEVAASLCTRLRPRARACGAANTLIRTADGFVGDNTDGAGLLAALVDQRNDPRGRAVVLIGAGGSARSIAHAFARAGVARLVVANRTPQRARDLVASLPRGRRADATGLDALVDDRLLGDVDVIVNCTSTGLGTDALPPLRFAALRRDVLCCDLVYGAKPSRFLQQAHAAGRRTIDGSGMLLHQGALAFGLWTGTAPPVAVMRRALRRALSGSRSVSRSG
jgi:shikimate dehydrogenase